MCDRHRITANAEIIRKADPTRTTTLRKQFYSEFYQRYKALSKKAVTSIVDNEILHTGLHNNAEIPPGNFDFLTDPQKVQSFLQWLEKELADDVYELYIYADEYPDAVLNGDWWADAYISKAYDKGTSAASTILSAQLGSEVLETMKNAPLHLSKVQMLYQRAFTDLKGINTTMASRLSQVLADGLVAGQNPKVIARNVVKQINGIGVYRAKMLSHTEIIRAHAWGTLQTFELAGLEEVEVQAEFLTAGDFRVCPKCRPLEGKRYKISEAWNIIPVHPFCRCTWVPYDPVAEKIIGKASYNA
jgi:SPP1 gp7 family putative phage head morphogenesis protein